MKYSILNFQLITTWYELFIYLLLGHVKMNPIDKLPIGDFLLEHLHRIHHFKNNFQYDSLFLLLELRILSSIINQGYLQEGLRSAASAAPWRQSLPCLEVPRCSVLVLMLFVLILRFSPVPLAEVVVQVALHLRALVGG